MRVSSQSPFLNQCLLFGRHSLLLVLGHVQVGNKFTVVVSSLDWTKDSCGHGQISRLAGESCSFDHTLAYKTHSCSYQLRRSTTVVVSSYSCSLLITLLPEFKSFYLRFSCVCVLY